MSMACCRISVNHWDCGFGAKPQFTNPREQLIEFGAQLFNAKFTIQEGAGRPHSKGTGARGDARLERRGSELPGVVEGGMSRRIDIRKPGTSRHRPRPRRIYCCGTAETPQVVAGITFC